MRDERKELEKALWNSRLSLPINTVFAVLGVAVVWSLHRYVGVTAWAAYVLGLFAVFSAISDAINIPYVKYKLRQYR